MADPGLSLEVSQIFLGCFAPPLLRRRGQIVILRLKRELKSTSNDPQLARFIRRGIFFYFACDLITCTL